MHLYVLSLIFLPCVFDTVIGCYLDFYRFVVGFTAMMSHRENTLSSWPSTLLTF